MAYFLAEAETATVDSFNGFFNMNKCRPMLGPVWIEEGGRRCKVELVESKLILGQFYSTLLYYFSLSHNFNGPLILRALGEEDQIFLNIYTWFQEVANFCDLTFSLKMLLS